jgi:hypothetical protein
MHGAAGLRPLQPRDFGVASAVQPESPGCPMDLILVAATVAFFAVSLAYVRGCDRL